MSTIKGHKASGVDLEGAQDEALRLSFVLMAAMSVLESARWLDEATLPMPGVAALLLSGGALLTILRQQQPTVPIALWVCSCLTLSGLVNLQFNAGGSGGALLPAMLGWVVFALIPDPSGGRTRLMFAHSDWQFSAPSLRIWILPAALLSGLTLLTTAVLSRPTDPLLMLTAKTMLGAIATAACLAIVLIGGQAGDVSGRYPRIALALQMAIIVLLLLRAVTEHTLSETLSFGERADIALALFGIPVFALFHSERLRDWSMFAVSVLVAFGLFGLIQIDGPQSYGLFVVSAFVIAVLWPGESNVGPLLTLAALAVAVAIAPGSDLNALALALLHSALCYPLARIWRNALGLRAPALAISPQMQWGGLAAALCLCVCLSGSAAVLGLLQQQRSSLIPADQSAIITQQMQIIGQELRVLSLQMESASYTAEGLADALKSRQTPDAWRNLGIIIPGLGVRIGDQRILDAAHLWDVASNRADMPLYMQLSDERPVLALAQPLAVRAAHGGPYAGLAVGSLNLHRIHELAGMAMDQTQALRVEITDATGSLVSAFDTPDTAASLPTRRAAILEDDIALQATDGRTLTARVFRLESLVNVDALSLLTGSALLPALAWLLAQLMAMRLPERFHSTTSDLGVFAEVINNTLDGHLLFDYNGNVLLGNAVFSELAGVSLSADARPNLLSSPLWNRAGLSQLAVDSMRTDEVALAHYPARRRDGRTVRTQVTLQPLRHQGEQRLLLHIGDQSATEAREQSNVERLRLETELAERDIRSAGSAAFLATISHELRTPMNALLGLGRILRGYAQTAATRTRCIELVQTSQRMLHLVNDLLDIAKADSGELKLASEPFSLQQVIDSIDDLIGPQCRSRSLTVVFDPLPDDVPIHYLGDAERLRQLLYNLMEQGLARTAQGYLRLATTLVQDAGDVGPARIRFTLTDTGVPVNTQVRESVLTNTPAIELDGAHDQHKTHLSMTLVSVISQAFNGQLTFKDSDSKRNITQVDITLQPLDGGGETMPDERFQRVYGLTILVVDDTRTNRRIASKLLQREGAQIAEAENGQEALEWLLKDGNQADIVLMDLQMPVMDGYEATERIRAIPALARLPIVALTSANTASEEKRALDSGMDAFLTKPFEPETVLRKLRALVDTLHRQRLNAAPLKRGVMAEQTDEGGWPDMPYIDEEAVRKRYTHPARYLRSLRNYVRTLDSYCKQLRLAENPALRRSQLTALRSLAINGSTVGADRLVRLAKHCIALSEIADWDSLPAALLKLDREIQIFKHQALADMPAEPDTPE